MQQVVVIGGAHTFDTYDEYLVALRGRTIDLERLRGKGWKSVLGSALGDEYEVISLRMPCLDNAKYLEWKIIFEKLLPLLSGETIFVGHSLGGVFLAKYCSEERAFEKLKALFLVASPYKDSEEYSLTDFAIEDGLKGLATSGVSIHLYQSEDDPIVPFSDFAAYQFDLPNAMVRIFKDRGHFLQEEFPELVEDIHQLQ